MLQETKKELEKPALPAKKNLQIEIDENSDYEAENQKLQDNLNSQLQKMEEKQEPLEQDEEEELMNEEDVLKEFDHLYRTDQELATMLGEFPDRYTLEEKLSIVQAYKKGGGVAGLAEIIDDEEDEPTTQGGQGGNKEEEEEDVDIDLDDPEDVKIIETEFRKLFDKDADFRTNFGEDAFELGPMQKYQIIDAYNKNGMEAVLALLTTSADQSGIEGATEDSVIVHEGKKYQRIQIEGLGEDEEYLMDEKGDIYSLDFKFITNMGDNVVVEE